MFPSIHQGRGREEVRRVRGQLLGIHELRLQGVQLRPAGKFDIIERVLGGWKRMRIA